MNQNFIEQNEIDLNALGLPLGSQEACRPKYFEERKRESKNQECKKAAGMSAMW